MEKYCDIVVDTISCRVQDTQHMLNIIDELNLEGIDDVDLLVSFDIINMFPSIDNQSGVERVRHKLNQYAHKIDVPVECVVEALSVIVPLFVDSIGCRKTVRLWALKILVHMPTS